MMGSKAKKWMMILFFIQLTTFIIFPSFGMATPDQNICSFHSGGGYQISSNAERTLRVQSRELFVIDIIAHGEFVIVQINPDTFDNDKFDVIPSRIVADNSPYDDNKESNIVAKNFTLRAPEEEGFYKIMFYARSPELIDGMPHIDCLKFEIIVGTLTAMDALKWIFSHLNIYLGLSAILFLVAAIILYEKNKFSTKIHGLLATAALILSLINVILAFDFLIWFFSNIRWSHPQTFYYLFHIITGLVGTFSGVLALLFGLAGLRSKKPGYIALVCWTIAFVTGILYWGVNFR